MCSALIKTSRIHSKATAHVQAPKQDCANHTGSRPNQGNVALKIRKCFYFSVSAAGASEENFNNFDDVHLENSVHAPAQGSSEGGGGARPLKRLEGYDVPSDQTRSSRLAPFGSDVRFPEKVSKTVRFVCARH